MKNLCTLVLLLAAVGIIVATCTKDVAEPPQEPVKGICDTLEATYDSQEPMIEPIIQTNCALSGCHGNGSSQGGVVLDAYEQVKEEALEGKLLCAVQHGDGCQPMPLSGDRLPDEDLQKIECWIEQGGPR